MSDDDDSTFGASPLGHTAVLAWFWRVVNNTTQLRRYHDLAQFKTADSDDIFPPSIELDRKIHRASHHPFVPPVTKLFRALQWAADFHRLRIAGVLEVRGRWGAGNNAAPGAGWELVPRDPGFLDLSKQWQGPFLYLFGDTGRYCDPVVPEAVAAAPSVALLFVSEPAAADIETEAPPPPQLLLPPPQPEVLLLPPPREPTEAGAAQPTPEVLPEAGTKAATPPPPPANKRERRRRGRKPIDPFYEAKLRERHAAGAMIRDNLEGPQGEAAALKKLGESDPKARSAEVSTIGNHLRTLYWELNDRPAPTELPS